MNNLDEFMNRLGYSFQDPSLLEQALTHSSYANEHHLVSNERLEFLGDSVLSFIAADHLYAESKEDEGRLTKERSSVVCQKALASYSETLEVGLFLKLGKGENLGGGRENPSILEDAFEAIVGAIYLDGGIEAAKNFALPFVQNELQNRKTHVFKDYKTQLQEIIQQNPGETLKYVLVDESGPDHNKRFTFEVHLNSNVIGRGKAKTKKEAEQLAAKEALALMGY